MTGPKLINQKLSNKPKSSLVEIKRLINDSSYLDQILLEGSIKAQEIASQKIKKIHEIMGF